MTPSAAEPSCRHIVFEALFVHGLEAAADPAFVADLRAAGLDLKAPEVEYPQSVMGRCLDAARRRRYPELTEAEAYRALGTRFVAGILNTMLGKVVAVAILVSGPDRSLKRIPGLMKSDYGVEVAARLVEARHYELSSTARLPLWVGPLFQGIFEEALRRTRVVPASVLKRGAEPGSFVIDVRWPLAA